MLLLTHAPEYGKNGILVMGDVAVTPVPDAEPLAQIAVCTARTAKSEMCIRDSLYTVGSERNIFIIGIGPTEFIEVVSFSLDVYKRQLLHRE